MVPKILIIDDDEEYIKDFLLLLESNYDCKYAKNEIEGLSLINSFAPDVVLLDLMLADGVSGLDVLQDILTEDINLPVIMITDYSSTQTAFEAVKKGAFDYISKTPRLDELKLTIEKSLKSKLEKFRRINSESELEKHFDTIIGKSGAITAVKEKILMFAKNNATVLITGESGVGKELVAHQIHKKSGAKDGPFIALNCAAIQKDLLESELFGHEKGAFTGAVSKKPGKFDIAENGTLFLDEISELLPEAQVKLLRVLQEKEFQRVGGTAVIRSNARIVAATNRDLKKMVSEGTFREDLFYRLDVLQIYVPPLRIRTDDIPLLANHFLKKCANEIKINIEGFSDSALNLLKSYNWPGNIRELQNVVTRAAIISQGKLITSELLSIHLNFSDNTEESIPETWEEMDRMRKAAAEKASISVERKFLEYYLEKYDYNISRAAEMMGINRTNLHKMIKRCGIEMKR